MLIGYNKHMSFRCQQYISNQNECVQWHKCDSFKSLSLTFIFFFQSRIYLIDLKLSKHIFAVRNDLIYLIYVRKGLRTSSKLPRYQTVENELTAFVAAFILSICVHAISMSWWDWCDSIHSGVEPIESFVIILFAPTKEKEVQQFPFLQIFNRSRISLEIP